MQTNFITKNKISRIKSLEDNIKSHNKMASFFSSVDLPTLKEQAVQCNNVLSLIVNNAGTYVAKFTERHKVHKYTAVTEDITTTDLWKYMGEKDDNIVNNSTKNSDKTEEYTEIRCWDCDIDRPLDVDIDEDFKKECIEKIDLFKKKKEEEKSIKVTNGFTGKLEVASICQPNLFGDECNNINTNRATAIRRMVNSLFELSFTPSCGYSYSNPYWNIDNLSDKLSPAFIELFINTWLTFYDPDAEELQKVMDIFSLRTENNCAYPITRDAILSYLTEVHEEYLDMELENDKQ